jgi:hypothetical protein
MFLASGRMIPKLNNKARGSYLSISRKDRVD